VWTTDDSSQKAIGCLEKVITKNWEFLSEDE
jgi:hypothetical protein